MAKKSSPNSFGPRHKHENVVNRQAKGRGLVIFVGIIGLLGLSSLTLSVLANRIDRKPPAVAIASNNIKKVDTVQEAKETQVSETPSSQEGVKKNVPDAPKPVTVAIVTPTTTPKPKSKPPEERPISNNLDAPSTLGTTATPKPTVVEVKPEIVAPTVKQQSPKPAPIISQPRPEVDTDKEQIEPVDAIEKSETKKEVNPTTSNANKNAPVDSSPQPDKNKEKETTPKAADIDNNDEEKEVVNFKLKAKVGDSVSHMARRAMYKYFKLSDPDKGLNRAQKLFFEVYLTQGLDHGNLNVGDTIQFDVSDLDQLFKQAKHLGSHQLAAWQAQAISVGYF